MTNLDHYCGKRVLNQDHFNGYCAMLLGRSPEKMDILAAENAKDFVIYDGTCWREFIPKHLRAKTNA